MVGVEWGPKNVPIENRKLLEVTRFSGGQLRDIEERVAPDLRENPSLSRDEVIGRLTQTDKEANRLQSGLDILIQLSVLGKGGADVRSVIVRQGVNTTIRRGEGEERARSGEGGPHYWYEIDWINAPVEKPVPVPQQVFQRKADQPAYSFKSAEQREAERSSRVRARIDERRARVERRRLEEERTAEKKEITDVVIDTVREVIDHSLRDGYIKIELGEDGVSKIYYRKYPWREHCSVDRETGEFKMPGEFSWSEYIGGKYLDYLQILAQQAEGKDVVYSLEKLDPKVYENIYERAIKIGMIKVVQDPEKGMVFQFVENPDSLWSKYGDMDLERNVINYVLFERERPINPHFSERLKLKRDFHSK